MERLIVNIRKEGYPFIGVAALLAALLFRTRVLALRVLGILPLLFVTWFFRDPDRVPPSGDDIVVSPADGTVLDVVETEEDRVGPCTKVSIFMSVFSVHVNRSPVKATVQEVRYRPGTFHVASMGKKTDDNERMIIYLSTDRGMFRVDQVAGLVARRIVCWLTAGQAVEPGERIGLIRFGSRVECWLPRGFVVTCTRGDKVCAGQTIIGRLL
ncbi:MAG TPA: phosphatidylserine decarboxylase family protein [Deltaproteobacteria bacterium]|nr:phosphatidylserine decarboxylase family protein [Deltaproteobacteria bacterium]